ncbi:MAG: serine hydrolase domain-containing protein [Bacteroidota bacterium]
MKNLLSFCFILILVSSCSQYSDESRKKNAKNAVIADSLTHQLNAIHQRRNFNGFAVAIVDTSGAVYQKGIGFSDVRKQKVYTTNTVQNIASISKTLIGISLMKAQEMELLNLDDPVNDYLPFEIENPLYPDEDITIRHLATHTSSIKDTDLYSDKSYILKDKLDSTQSNLEELSENFNPKENKIRIGEFLERYFSEDSDWYDKKPFLDTRPGELFEYTNVGATLAACVIEIAAEKPYSEFATEHIFEPLKMKSSGWDFDEVDYNSFSTLYSSLENVIPHYSLITYPDGGLITSINDLGLYLSELIRGYSGKGTLLTNESYHELFKYQLKPENFTEQDEEHPYNDEYNAGIFMGFSAKGYIGHSGGDPGVASLMMFNAESGVGRILFTNTNVNNQAGVDAFWGIWNTLGDYSEKLN